jgi:dolichol kinase
MASTASSSSGFNGETAVVLLFIARVFFSLPLSLLLHGLALSLLALSALFVEITADTSPSLSLLKTRYFPSPTLFLRTLFWIP